MPAAEPVIAYGAFNLHGLPIRPGSEGDSHLIGYGIINPPKALRRSTVANFADDISLTARFNDAMVHHKRELKAEEFDAIENKLEILRGLSVHEADITTDHFYVYAESPYTYHSFSLYFGFGLNLVSYGLASRDEIRRNIPWRTKIVDVSGSIITLENGFRFAVVPRLAEEAVVGFRDHEPTDADKANLLDHYKANLPTPNLQ